MPHKAMLLSILSFAAAIDVVSGAVHHSNEKAVQLKGSAEFKHRIRVCNAYPYAAALDLFRGMKKLTKLPLDYKMCGDFSTPLVPGDKLKFKVGDANAGTFTISDLPNNDAILLLVIHRHDTLSNAVSFESHVFANLLNAQIAVIDTYKGRARGYAEISDGGKTVEKLKYNSVVAVNPGEYRVRLRDHNGKEEAVEDLVALNRESYVILRTGVESQQGPAYPEDIVVYPMSDPALLHSASIRTSVSAVLMIVVGMLFLSH